MNFFKSFKQKEKNSSFYLPPSEVILDNITSGFLTIDNNWCVTYINPSLLSWVKLRQEEVIGSNIWKVFPDEVHTKFYSHYYKAMKERVPVFFEEYYASTKEWIFVKVYPSKEGLTVYANNITKEKVYEEEIFRRDYYDYLTELPNRLCFEKKLQEVTEQGKLPYNRFALVHLDLDRVKYINDTLGRDAGNELIKKVASRLLDVLGEKCYLARIGGDSFAIILSVKAADQVVVEQTVKRIINNFKKNPFFIQKQKLHVTTSFGVCLYPEHADSGQSLMAKADIALSLAKKRGGNRCVFFQKGKENAMYKRFSLERDLHDALIHNQFELYYQPRVHIKSGKIKSVEALIRWNHPHWGVVSPAEFIPIAEDTRLIHPLTDWIVYTVCKQIKAWEKEGITLIPISINVPAHHFLKEDFVENVKRVIEEIQIHGKWLEVEITETFLLESQQATIETIRALKQLGIKVALDDFGAGYSSLAYLTKFNVNTLKIDKSIVENATHDISKAAVIQSIITLAHGLGMEVVAEGVETQEELNFLRNHHCDEIQGFIFSKPVSAETLLKLVGVRFLTPMDQEATWQNRRKHNRISLYFPSSAHMSAEEIRLGKTEVLIEEISVGGLRFVSHLRQEISNEVMYNFVLELLGVRIRISGELMWESEVEKGLYRYGIRFCHINKKREQFEPLLVELGERMEINPLVPDCRIIRMDKSYYLQHVVAKEN